MGFLYHLNEEEGQNNAGGIGQELVMNALDQRTGVVIKYSAPNNNFTEERYIEPYVLGRTKTGALAIRAYQYYGSTKTGAPKWKLFRLDRITSWQPTEEHFNLEPKARGWAAQAYNNNGDGSLIEIVHTVKLDEEPLTDYEKLKARTQRLKAGSRININSFGQTKKEEPVKKKSPSGPVGNTPAQSPESPTAPNPAPQNQAKSEPITSPEQVKNEPISQDKFQRELQTNLTTPEPVTEKPPIDKEPNQNGPITSEPKPEAQKQPEQQKTVSYNNGPVMNQDDFAAMLKRNLEITAKEKEKRNQKYKKEKLYK